MNESMNQVFLEWLIRRSKTVIFIAQDEKLLVFTDRSPAAKHHFLVIPKEHIKDIKSLRAKDIPLVEQMKEVGLKVLREQDGNVEKVCTGFHWPIHTVSHLHMHIISPADNLTSFFKKMEFSRMFFGSTEDAIQMLQKQ